MIGAILVCYQWAFGGYGVLDALHFYYYKYIFFVSMEEDLVQQLIKVSWSSVQTKHSTSLKVGMWFYFVIIVHKIMKYSFCTFK